VNNRLKEINSNLNELDSIIKNNESTVKNFNRTFSLSVIISWVISVLSLMIAIFALVKVKANIARAGRHRKEIDELKQSLSESETRLMNASRNYGISTTRLSSHEYSDLSSRICRIESQLKQQFKPKQSEIKPDIAYCSNDTLNQEKNGYFDIPKQKSATEAYFECLIDSRTPDSCFHVIVKNEKAQFRPIEEIRFLNDIKSYDIIKLALEIEGVLLAEAKQFRIIKPGEATLNGKRWEITKKAKIELFK
ncbi:MAG: hypothetical protein K2N34_12200, partial [Lachnospiraceae bacterium]|nr:hypothetical protein [Lachnospiraceae bacterium]